MGSPYLHLKRGNFSGPPGVAFDHDQFVEFRRAFLTKKGTGKTLLTKGKLTCEGKGNGEVMLTRTSIKGTRTLLLTVKEVANLMSRLV